MNTAPLFFTIAMLCGMWDLCFPTSDQTHSPALGVESRNQWTPREVLAAPF